MEEEAVRSPSRGLKNIVSEYTDDDIINPPSRKTTIPRNVMTLGKGTSSFTNLCRYKISPFPPFYFNSRNSSTEVNSFPKNLIEIHLRVRRSRIK